MKQLLQSYFKVVLIIFAILYVIYLIFEFTILDSQINFLQSIIKILLLAMLLPLFSKRYLAQVSSEENLKRFKKTRNNLFILVGTLVFIGIFILLIIFVFTTKTFN